ncbi:MAG TPA: hypothetical protein VIL37_16985 [Natronosporangium sp.]
MVEGPPFRGADLAAQHSADRLALALESIGFDVGQAFPMLGSGRDHRGRPRVELGRVAAVVADQLSTVLLRAAEHGIVVSADERDG